MHTSDSHLVTPDRVVTALADRRRTILEVIGRAAHRLSLSIFRCNDDAVIEGLASAVARGVVVDVLTTSRAARGGRKRLEKLRKKLSRVGVTVHAYPDAVVKYHAKYLIADDGPAIVGSLNLTRKCFTGTCDAFVVTHDPQIVAGLQRLMAADRVGQPVAAPLNGRLLVGPEGARERFKEIIETACSSIRLIDPKLSDPEFLQLLAVQRAAGVRVSVYDARWLGDLKSHGKIMLVDDRLAVIGSAALASASLDRRREVSIVVEEPSAVAQVVELFNAVAAVSVRTRSGKAPVGVRLPAGEAGRFAA
jgi:phosphatidylserine/phosphatidylglycerophosphate/cardiolipin synthase-like enzyme